MAQVYKNISEDIEDADTSENTEETYEDKVNENENGECCGVIRTC
jgi:hypothetical protein